ncbi:hypothetical protein GCM10023160_00710 [Brachybacterium paraconglomeratum]
MTDPAAEDQASTDPMPHGEPAKDDQEPVFGEKTSSRFAADIEYTGSTGRHDYLVRVRHRLLDTTFTVAIDGIEHDPKAEMKARSPEESAEHAAGPWAEDDLRFTLKDGFTTLLCTVRRPRDEGSYVNAEDITVRTVGLGGAGEVDIRHGFKRIVLVPADGSPSAAREEKRAAHPTRYALVAALTKSARYLVPLLGLGALFSGLLDPLVNWIEARVRPALEAIARMTEPPREWIAQLLRPIQEFLEAVFSPIKEFFAMLLRPVRDLLAWLVGLLPDIDLPFGIPEWVVDLAIPVVVVVAVFSGTRKTLRSRGERLAAAKAMRSPTAGEPGPAAETGTSGNAGSAKKASDPEVEDQARSESLPSEGVSSSCGGGS